MNDINKSTYQELEKKIQVLEKELKTTYENKHKFKERWQNIFKGVTTLFTGRKLSKSIKHIHEKIASNQKVNNDDWFYLFTGMFTRIIRVGTITVLLALLPFLILLIQTSLLYNQNELFDGQNTKMDSQNILLDRQNNSLDIQNDLMRNQNNSLDIQNNLFKQQNNRLDQQTYLLEAERRSSLVFLFSNVMDAIDEELKKDYKKDTIRNLSPQLIGRIISLSQRLKPYRYLNNNTIIPKPLSPERGHLLINLIESELSDYTYMEIWKRGDFSYSDLNSYNLISTRRIDIPLDNYGEFPMDDYGDFPFVSKDKTYLEFINLENANLENVNFSTVSLNHANLINTNLNNTNLEDATLMNTSMSINWKKQSLIGKNKILSNYTENVETNELTEMKYIRFSYK
jgi:hypothetical protein